MFLLIELTGTQKYICLVIVVLIFKCVNDSCFDGWQKFYLRKIHPTRCLLLMILFIRLGSFHDTQYKISPTPKYCYKYLLTNEPDEEESLGLNIDEYTLINFSKQTNLNLS